MEHIIWGGLSRLVYFPVFLVLIVILLNAYIFQRSRVRQLAHKNNRNILLPTFSRARQKVKTGLLIISVLSIALAILQPQWGKKEEHVMQQGRDLLVLLDVSRSMAACDIKPSRLEFVKLKVRKLLDQLTFERVGLILFSGSAFVQTPLTSDYPTFKRFLHDVSIESVSSGTTNIGAALETAVQVFKRSKNRKHKQVLLITDGEDFASDMTRVGLQVKEENITVMAWGVGSERGAPVPVFDQTGRQIGHEKDEQGNIILTKLDRVNLEQISQDINGSYYQLTQSDGDIRDISRDLQKIEKEDLGEKELSEYHERYPIFLGIAWLCLLLEWIL